MACIGPVSCRLRAPEDATWHVYCNFKSTGGRIVKKWLGLALGLGLMAGGVSSATAAEIRASGEWAFDLSWTDNLGYRSAAHGDKEDDFNAHQRLRTQIDILASENLSGVLFLEMGDSLWGSEDAALGADGKTVKVRRSFVDWNVPGTGLAVRMGIQGLDLPGATFGASPILSDEDVAALTLSYAVNDTVAVTGFWARPYDGANSNAADGNRGFDEVDLFGLSVPVTLDGFSITPHAMYASIGKDVDGSNFDENKWNSGSWEAFSDGMHSIAQQHKGVTPGESSRAWWAGVAFEMSLLSPFELKADLTYGTVSNDDEALERSGWLASAMASYKLDMVTPAVFGWYGSGEDDDLGNGSERMPSVSAQAWAPTSFGFPGSAFQQDTNFARNGAGLMGIGVQAGDISFIEDLTHVVRVAYMRGTNDADLLRRDTTLRGDLAPGAGAVFLTDKDSAWEVNFDHEYKIYENLTMIVEMGLIRLNLDEDAWGDEADNLGTAKKATVNLVYEF